MSHTVSHQHSSKRILATLCVTGSILITELVGAWLSGSLALLADAGHMLVDLFALSLAYVAILLARKPADDRRTFGYRRLEILAALLNGIILLLISGSIAYHGFLRLNSTNNIDTHIMGGVAAVGLVANLIGLALLHGGRSNLNIRGAFLHLLGDTLSSVGVLLTSVIISMTGMVIFDAITSILIAIVIVWTSIQLLRDVFDILLESAPAGIKTEDVRSTINQVSGVKDVHDLHVWSITTGMPALSAHVIASSTEDHHVLLKSIRARLQQEFQIHHSTLQIEPYATHDCGGC